MYLFSLLAGSSSTSGALLQQARDLLLAHALGANQINVGSVGQDELGSVWDRGLDEHEKLRAGVLLRLVHLWELAVFSKDNGELLWHLNVRVLVLGVLLEQSHGAATGLSLLGVWDQVDLTGEHSLVLADVLLELLLAQHLWAIVVAWLRWALNGGDVGEDLLHVASGSQVVDQQLVWGSLISAQTTLTIAGCSIVR